MQITQEFGTIAGIYVARALILEAAAFNHARGTDIHQKMRKLVRDAFYVDDLPWMVSVQRLGSERFNQALSSFTQTLYKTKR